VSYRKFPPDIDGFTLFVAALLLLILLIAVLRIIY
jgi:hypothetical protein